MSFNLWHDHDWDARKALVVSELRRESPDIAGLQEALVWQLDYLTSVLPQYHFVAAGRDDGKRDGESVGILFKKDRFDVDTSGTFWFSDEPQTPGSMPGEEWGNPNYPRIATWLRLHDRETGRHFYHFNVHLQHDAGSDPNLARTRSVELLLARIADRDVADPVLVTGDFNAAENDIPVRFITSGASINFCPEIAGRQQCRTLKNAAPFVDTLREQYTGPAQGTRCFADDTNGRRIDYILVSDGSDVHAVSRGTKIDGTCPSDHHFVLATVSF